MTFYDEPLWLPKGSIRALFTAGLLLGSFYLCLDPAKCDPAITEKWFSMTLVALGYYIGVRRAGNV